MRTTASTMRARSITVWTIVLLGSSGSADVTPPSDGTESFSSGAEAIEYVYVDTPVARIETSNRTVVRTILDAGRIVSEETVDLPFAGAGAQSIVQQSAARLTSSGVAAVTVPILVQSIAETTGSSTSFVETGHDPAPASTNERFLNTIGPGTILIHEGVSTYGAPIELMSCDIAAGFTHLHVAWTDIWTVYRDAITTETVRETETYEIRGTTSPRSSHFLPTKCKVALKGDGKDGLTAAGFFDDGGVAPDFAQPVTLEVGGFSQTASLVPDAKGRVFTLAAGPLVFKLLPRINGSSRGRFKLTVKKATLGALVPADGDVEFRLRVAGLSDVTGRIRVQSGGYQLGRVRGALLDPPLVPAKAKVKLAGEGADSFSVTASIATKGAPAPASIGSFLFLFGDDYSLVVPGATFTKSAKGDIFTHSAADGGTTTKVTIDFTRELVTVSGKKSELGALVGDTVDVVVGLGDGTPAVRTKIRLGRKGKSITY